MVLVERLWHIIHIILALSSLILTHTSSLPPVASEGCWTLNLADLAKKAMKPEGLCNIYLYPMFIIHVYHMVYVCLLHIYIYVYNCLYPIRSMQIPLGISDVFCICKHAANMLQTAMPAMRSALDALASTLPARIQVTGLSLYWASTGPGRPWKAWSFGDLNVVGGQHFLREVMFMMSGNVWKCMEMFGNVWKCLEMLAYFSCGTAKSGLVAEKPWNLHLFQEAKTIQNLPAQWCRKTPTRECRVEPACLHVATGTPSRTTCLRRLEYWNLRCSNWTKA